MAPKISHKKFKSKTVKTKGYYFIIIFLALILFDRMTKIWASNLKISKDYGLVSFTYITNTGAGFSILQNMNIILIVISILVIIALIYFNKHIPKFSLITILSGITGNLIDRVSYGSVIDFINFKFWPVFNIADSLIFIGVAYWMIIIIKSEKTVRTKNNKN